MINCYEAGIPKRIILLIFQIGKDTLNHWIRHYKEDGRLAAKVKTQHKPRKFSDEALLSYIEQYPSATLEDIAHHLSVKIPSVHARLTQCNMKKETSKHALNSLKNLTLSQINLWFILMNQG